jgi:hypothetical protein
MGGETKAGVSSYKVSTGNTDTVSRKSALRSVTQGLGNDVWDMLYNSSGQPHIPLRHSGSFPQYTSAGRITKSAEEPGCFGHVCDVGIEEASRLSAFSGKESICERGNFSSP